MDKIDNGDKNGKRQDGFITRFDIGVNSIGIKDKSIQNSDFKVYPNPGSNILYIEIPFLQNEEVVITIYDVNGKLVHSKSVSGNEGIEKFELNISSLTFGMYFITASNQKTFSTKYVKQ